MRVITICIPVFLIRIVSYPFMYTIRETSDLFLFIFCRKSTTPPYYDFRLPGTDGYGMFLKESTTIT